ncbi:MAG: hypothetical protein ACSW8H_00470 [bacterium]
MSDLLIRGMEMPTSCWDCYFQDCGNCRLNAHKVVDKCIIEDRRDEDCPLAPVPPHGRLGDLDALYESCVLDTNIDVMASAKRINEYMQLKIDDAPTIIPAEPCNNLSKPCKEDKS